MPFEYVRKDYFIDIVLKFQADSINIKQAAL